ncbi:hypothetical protein DM02DRAFT_85004 [Periconia macrospinosa]|uniref:Uncharacterized protein n=1 Tax=Periconia macrospinosa TaxID=97972 RepID=A0A2V1E698_9PLEO|nr:hypothetical protein DM02DRAFT_85004 [Periconia macrospinosa]
MSKIASVLSTGVMVRVISATVRWKINRGRSFIFQLSTSANRKIKLGGVVEGIQGKVNGNMDQHALLLASGSVK